MKRLLGNIRTLLVLGRVSNLPTVWSNILAGWLIIVPLAPAPLILLLISASCLYIGGMYLNDFCDAKFDTEFCKDRPIPMGMIQRPLVGALAAIWFLFGLGCLVVFNVETLAIGATLTAAIVLYDFHHKSVAWAPVLMGTCRALLYLLAGSAAKAVPDILELRENLSLVYRHEVLSAVALGAYIAGITYLARGESRPEKPTRWALALLIAPLILSIALCITFRFYAVDLMICWAMWLAWTIWLLLPFWRRTKPSVGRVVSGLLAGIILVDTIAAVPVGHAAFWFFLPLFVLALLLQRLVPAT